MLNGEKVTAIKLYYLRHPGIKLQDAKKAVEDMEAKMKGFNTTKSYWCIVTNSDDTEMYLGWQKPVWDESGYFWTSKETIKKIVDTNNTLEHPFIFSSREEAIKHLKSMHLPQKCRVVKWDVSRLENGEI